MVRFGRRRRRFGRRPRRRAARPRTLLRKSRRLRKVAFRKIQKKKTRRNKKIKKNVWGYMDATNDDADYNQSSVVNLSNSATTNGLGRYDDVDKIFDQVRQFDDILFATQTGLATEQRKANRGNIKVNVSGKAIYTVASNNQVGGIYAQIYIVRPRSAITTGGIGSGAYTTAAQTIANSYNSRSAVDYNDAAGFAINAVGTGGVTNIEQNSISQAKPTVASTDSWTTPFMVPEFTRNYKVLKVHKVFLPPNGNFMFTVKLPLTTIERNMYQISTASAAGAGNVVWHPKFARQVFIRFHGSPCRDATTASLVNFGKASLNTVIDKKYEFSYGVQPTYFNVRGTDTTGAVTSASAPGLAEQVEANNP